ncbi:MAG: phosphotransferase family protein [Acidimicrobiia bacterium]
MSHTGSEGTVDRLSELVVPKWTDWLGADPPDVEWVLESTARLTAQTSIILYAIDPTARSVPLVAKVNRDPRFGSLIRQESERMRQARDALGPDQQQTVPRPLGLLEIGGDTYLISEFAREGHRWDQLEPPLNTKIADRLAAWLAQLHEGSERTASSIDTGFPALVAKYYCEVFAPPESVTRRLTEAAESVAAEFAAANTEILVHGDFWPGNWRINESEFKVIDWENAHWSPSPVLDEFLYPLSSLTLGQTEPDDDLMSFGATYRRHRRLPPRRRDEAELASIWTAAEVATRTHRRWGVVEDWAIEWHRTVMQLAMHR